jgi:hypothetical protein
MAIKYEIETLFAVPLFKANIGYAISKEQIVFIKDLKMVTNRDNLISENLYIFQEPELDSIKVAVQDALDIYASKVMGITQKLYVTQSWSLVNHPGAGMHTHSHSNSVISGSLYYCDLPSPNSRMIFNKHSVYQQLELNPVADKRSVYNSPVNVVIPERDSVVLFPSDLNHLVESNTATQPRYSIAFNCFIRGKLGSYRDVSELEL